MERAILHCDLNSFYASVEIKLNPELKGKAVAVCGSVEDRHGIVLAKSDLAKKAGVQTAEAIWQAQKKCPGLIIVQPHYEQYIAFSKATRKIYEDYTDLIEPFGIDECWLDVTGSRNIFGSGEKIAHEIRERVKREVGITISAGVSFNKTFAKLGSDMKKPDAVTIIPYDGFKEKIWGLPASDMLWVGHATAKTLAQYGVFTIGELATLDVDFLVELFGINGKGLWNIANGFDNAPVMPMGYSYPIKSVGHGTTSITDMTDNEQIWRVIYELSQDVARRLRKHGLSANGIQLSVKDKDLAVKQYQAPLPITTQCFYELADNAMRLFVKNWNWYKPVRALTVRAINLVDASNPVQINLAVNFPRHEKQEKIETAIESVRGRFGKKAVNMCSLIGDLNIAKGPCGHGIPVQFR